MKTTNNLYLSDSYLRETTAKIIDITTDGQKTRLILDKTVFYPVGGGQPSDQGTIHNQTGTMHVTSARYSEGHIEHSGKIDGELSVGQTVIAAIDWQLRYKHMQLHTAGHILDEAVKTILPEFHGKEGMHGINNQKYIEYDGFIDKSYEKYIIECIHDIIHSNEPISSEIITKEEIESRKIFLPFELPKNKTLRIVQFGSREPIPDGGTQLKTTGELWPVSIEKFEYIDKNTKIHYTVQVPKTDDTKTHRKTIISGNTPIEEFSEKIFSLKNMAEVDQKNPDFHQMYLGKKGRFNELAKSIKDIETERKGDAGKLLNDLKKFLESLSSSPTTNHPPLTTNEFFDPTIPGITPQLGHTHLITQAIDEIEQIFSRLGFIRRRYPEIESDWYYAEGLNIPKNHPARDDQETFYLEKDVVLTAHTSNGQLREMEFMGKPPIKMINIGKTYRRQASNTHSPMFHQFEGLLIDKNITMSHLVGVSNYFVKQYFGEDREIRLRPHHFQFTEPSFEVDINCQICKGKGVLNGTKCKVCKSGWLELGGAGMVHPIVLKNGGIDPDMYSGFAFGWGVERVIMMKHHVTDNLRELYTQDLRFLSQS
jgi:phenylalanyl-tRNA synthetase alpha chain